MTKQRLFCDRFVLFPVGHLVQESHSARTHTKNAHSKHKVCCGAFSFNDRSDTSYQLIFPIGSFVFAAAQDLQPNDSSCCQHDHQSQHTQRSRVAGLGQDAAQNAVVGGLLHRVAILISGTAGAPLVGRTAGSTALVRRATGSAP